MPARSSPKAPPLPRGWTRVVNAAVLHAISLAATALRLSSNAQGQVVHELRVPYRHGTSHFVFDPPALWFDDRSGAWRPRSHHRRCTR